MSKIDETIAIVKWKIEILEKNLNEREYPIDGGLSEKILEKWKLRLEDLEKEKARTK